MTKTIAAPAANAVWNRRKNLPRGFRLYCSPEWLAHYRGLGKPDTKWLVDDPDWASRPELPSRFNVLQLDDEAVDWRYLSLTARLRRYWQIADLFADIADGGFVPTKYPPFTGTPQLPPLGRGPDGRWYLVPAPPPEWHGPAAEWRARAAEIWAALPANDSEIFPRQASSEEPKLAHLAEQLAPLLKWAGARMPLSLDATNWLQADNDSYFEGEAASAPPASNRERRIRPGSSDAELKSYIAKAGPCTVRKHARFGGGGAWEVEPIGVDVRRAGKLRLASGETEVACTVMRNDKPARGRVRVEAGTILYQPERFGELLGPEPDPFEKARSLSYWHSLMSHDGGTASCRLLEPVRHIKAGRKRRKALMTQAEQLEVLATKPHPPTTYCKPGLPCGHEDIGAQFVGGWISNTKGKSGVERWQDVSDELSRQAEFERWAKALPPEQQKALNLACTAANLREIGEAFGKVDKNAERYGKKILIKANDNLKKLMAA